VPPPPVLLNGDLTAEHVLGERAGGRWAPTGIFDFGDARLGDPAWDLLAAYLDLFRCDRDLLRACLAAASWTPGPAFAREAMAFALLHEWDVLAEVHVPPGHYATLDELAAALWGV